jgi:hypothetical protein
VNLIFKRKADPTLKFSISLKKIATGKHSSLSMLTDAERQVSMTFPAAPNSCPAAQRKLGPHRGNVDHFRRQQIFCRSLRRLPPRRHRRIEVHLVLVPDESTILGCSGLF